MQNRPDSPSRSRCASGDDVDLRTRIRAEFSEMPGLKLTLPQAARLFNLEHARCERVLGALVNGGALSSDGKAFVRAGDGRRWTEPEEPAQEPACGRRKELQSCRRH